MAVFDKFQQVVFIVSNGRTGTTALAQHLDESYEQVCALHEPRPTYRMRCASNKALCGRMGRAALVDLLTRSRRALADRIPQPIYVESNPFLAGFIEAFGDTGRDVKVLHVVRDPRTYIRSGINFGAFRGLKGLFTRFVPYWMPKPDYCAGNPERWNDMHPAARLAWFWATVNRDLNRGEQIYGNRYLRVRFEDLFAKDGSGLHRLTDWMGLPRSAKLTENANRENVNASKDAGFPKWKDWDPALQRQVLRYCGELMELYGYPIDQPSNAKSPAIQPATP